MHPIALIDEENDPENSTSVKTARFKVRRRIFPICCMIISAFLIVNSHGKSFEHRTVDRMWDVPVISKKLALLFVPRDPS